ncbi:MAG: decarboxylase [Peptococcaceae bacterium]|nr:decarboxylase [Peptococcaceae bacterium]
MNNALLEDVLMQYETPMYIFDTDQLSSTITEFKECTLDRIGLCFAMKANPFLVTPIAEFVDRIEVCSPGEFEICRSHNIPAHKILISGVLKRKKDIFRILDYYDGACLVSIESPQQFALVGAWSNEHHQTVNVLLRLSSGNQFGMDETTIFQLIESREQWPFINIKGLHYFSGTQKRIEKTLSEVMYLDHFLEKINESYGFQFDALEFGPGLAVPLFQGKNNEMIEELKKICSTIADMTWCRHVTLEMGRAFASDCGTYLTRVIDTKSTEDSNYAIVDGGMHHLHYNGQIRGMYHPHFHVLSRKAGKKSKPWCICGALCTTNDILVQKYEYTLFNNDVLVFKIAGAYTMTEGMSLFLSHALPKILLYSKENGWKLIRNNIETWTLNMSQEERNG